MVGQSMRIASILPLSNMHFDQSWILASDEINEALFSHLSTGSPVTQVSGILPWVVLHIIFHPQIPINRSY